MPPQGRGTATAVTPNLQGLHKSLPCDFPDDGELSNVSYTDFKAQQWQSMNHPIDWIPSHSSSASRQTPISQNSSYGTGPRCLEKVYGPRKGPSMNNCSASQTDSCLESCLPLTTKQSMCKWAEHLLLLNLHFPSLCATHTLMLYSPEGGGSPLDYLKAVLGL